VSRFSIASFTVVRTGGLGRLSVLCSCIFLFTAFDFEKEFIAPFDEQRRRAIRRLEDADATAIAGPKLRTASFAAAGTNA